MKKLELRLSINKKYMNKMIKTGLLFGLLSLLVFAGCKKDEDPLPIAGNFGEITSAVIIVNPVINDGSTTTVTSGQEREGVRVSSGNLDPVTTDATGLTVLKGLPTGIVSLDFDNGSVSINVVQDKELYDVVVSYKDNVTEIVEEIRYAIGGEVIEVEPGEDLSEPFNTDNAIIILGEGSFEGDYNITGEGILVFGTWNEVNGAKSVFTGNITVSGGGVRMRGLKIEGLLTVNANSYSAAFSDFNNANIKGNNVSLIRNVFSGDEVVVPSSSAVLLDNSF